MIELVYIKLASRVSNFDFKHMEGSYDGDIPDLTEHEFSIIKELAAKSLGLPDDHVIVWDEHLGSVLRTPEKCLNENLVLTVKNIASQECEAPVEPSIEQDVTAENVAKRVADMFMSQPMPKS